jgi:hypothetical protein
MLSGYQVFAIFSRSRRCFSDGVNPPQLPDPNSHFGGGRQNIESVLGEGDRLGIPRLP